MKRQIISFAAMCALTVTLHAQTAYLSEIAINNRHIEKNAARQVEVSFEVDLSQLDIKRQHSLQLVPVIVSADRSQEAALPPIIINGKVRDRVQNREAALDKTELNPEAAATIRRKNGSTQTYDYRASVPFKQWMIGGELEIRGYATGCAQCDEGNETNYTGEILPPMTPAYARPFMEPKEETVKRRAETKVARLQFRQDSHTIDPKYKGNRNELDSIRRSLNIVNDNNDLDITGIYVTGYASPEGTFPYNMQLSPKEIVRELNRFIVGQDDAKRAVAIGPEEHSRRTVPRGVERRGLGGTEKTGGEIPQPAETGRGAGHYRPLRR